jgi:hypothetical protein
MLIIVNPHSSLYLIGSGSSEFLGNLKSSLLTNGFLTSIVKLLEVRSNTCLCLNEKSLIVAVPFPLFFFYDESKTAIGGLVEWI